MHYNQYLYRLSVQAVSITDKVKSSISATDVIADPIIGTSLEVTSSLPQVNHQKTEDRYFTTDYKYSDPTTSSTHY